MTSCKWWVQSTKQKSRGLMPRAELQMVLWNGLTKLQLEHLREPGIPSLGSPSFFLFSEVLIYISSVWENSQLPRISWAQRFEKEHIGHICPISCESKDMWCELGYSHYHLGWGIGGETGGGMKVYQKKKHCELNLGMCLQVHVQM